MLVKFCSRTIEACWLVALAGIPVFFNPYTTRVFESDKTYLLRSITIVMLIAWLIKRQPGNPALNPGSGDDLFYLLSPIYRALFQFQRLFPARRRILHAGLLSDYILYHSG